MKRTLKKIEEKGYDTILTFEQTPNVLERLFGFEEGEVKFIGSGTIWYNMETRSRVNVFMEGWLSSIVRFKEEYKKDLPNE